jgi:hypothetical protein
MNDAPRLGLESGVSSLPFRLIGSEDVPLTLDKAKQHRDLPGSPTERELNARRVYHLRKKVEAGLTVPFMWADARMHDALYRVNGQHSSAMLCELDGLFPKHAVAHIDHYEVDDVNGLVMLFRQFDDRKSARTPIDVSGAYQNIQGDLDEVPRPIAKQGIEGVCWYRRNVLGTDEPQGDDQYILFNRDEYHPFLNWLVPILGPKVPEVKKTPIVAAMLATFESAADDATTFWTDVIQGGREYEDEHPASTLFDWLHRFKEEEFKVKQTQLYQGSIYAWNAFRDGKDTLRDIKADIKRGMHKVL